MIYQEIGACCLRSRSTQALRGRLQCKETRGAADGLSNLPTARSSDCRTLFATTRMVLRCAERRTPQNIPLHPDVRRSAVSSTAFQQVSTNVRQCNRCRRHKCCLYLRPVLWCACVLISLLQSYAYSACLFA